MGLPDPIDNPYKIGVELNRLTGVVDEDGDPLAINSIDVLDWTIQPYNFEQSSMLRGMCNLTINAIQQASDLAP